MQNKSQLNLSIPAKTFLLGEYLALSTGPSLVLAHEPSFRFDFFAGRSEDGIHPESPAGLWKQRNPSVFEQICIETSSSLAEAGGFGASTAQFLAVWLYTRVQKQKNLTDTNEQLAVECWQDYRSFFSQAPLPSGADLISQICGGLTSWDPVAQKVSRWVWPFADLRLHLFKTPQKIKTHEHLKNLHSEQIPQQELLSIAQRALTAVQEKNSALFLRESALYTEVLKKAGLQSAEAIEGMMKVAQNPDVLSVRGCGALGADVMAVYTTPRTDLDLQEFGFKKISVVPETISSGPQWSLQ
jgi:hypothetical protein